MADSGTHTPLRVDMYHGDCLEVMPTLTAGSAAMCFADLPYAVTSCQWDVAIDLDSFWGTLAAALQPHAVVCATAVLRFACALLQSNPLPFKYDLVWHKIRGTGFFNAKNAPLKAHELLLFFGKGKSTYNPQMRTSLDPRRGAEHVPAQRSEYLNLLHKDRTYVRTDKRYPVSVLQVAQPNAERGKHPTQKPVALLDWLIKTYTNPGETVLDPVSGSATTAIAAIRNGRNVICVEKDPVYFSAGVERVKAEIAASGVRVELRTHL